MQAFQIALRERQFPLLDVLINLTQMMVEGELMQLETIGMLVAEDQYMELIDRKTASLFSACARLGALSTGASEATERRLGEYAWNLGIAFQLVDDVLDFTSREKILGKPVGNDLREGKVTLPLIYALETADQEERKLVETVLADGNYDQVPFGKILQILHRHQGVERAQKLAQSYTEKARTIIAEFPPSPYQKGLMAVTDLVTERDR
jgi:octaprenyl-diphosphate synthase